MEKLLKSYIIEASGELFGKEIPEGLIQLQETRKEFAGDYTLVVFPLLKISGKSPEITGKAIGDRLVEKFPMVGSYNVVKGFLNIELSDKVWIDSFLRKFNSGDVLAECKRKDPETILVEYSSPNTNKPLHLGHIRNNLLGFSLYRILSSCGNRVIKTNIVNDRGIHICKSMLAWKKYGNGENPSDSGIKGDHLVGKYYVVFENELRRQISDLVSGGMDENEARNEAPLMKEARSMLLKWESGDKETIDLWKKMNSWVYEGFDETYKKLGVDFDKIYYESETYTLGREIVLKGLKDNILYRNTDNSVWVDLSDVGLDQKLLLRSDSTAVYITQDLGTAVLRHEHYKFDRCLYVVGNEQIYHFQVLREVMRKMGYPWAHGLIHFSYGMVELPEGKMKSREGKVVDADDLIAEMTRTAGAVSEELGKLSGFNEVEKAEIFRKIGLGALKYFILKVDPKKNMTFNPGESIDFNGNTGPFIQYTYARIMSVLRKADDTGVHFNISNPDDLNAGKKEIVMLRLLNRFSQVVGEAAESLSPALLANYCYELAREYNQFYHDYPILGEPDIKTRNLRLALSELTGRIINTGMWLLGIEMPERM